MQDSSNSSDKKEEQNSKQDTKESVKEKVENEQKKETAFPEKKGKTGQKEDKKKAKKEEQKKDSAKKKVEHGPDFKYIVRLSNTDINGEKNILYGLTTIRGIGLHMATLIADQTGINRYMIFGDLTDDQIQKIQEKIDSITNNAPDWMLNHRKDSETGDDIHLISTQIDTKLRDEINIMKKIRSYKGIRHERGLPVRGQRTRANNRKGLALGVSKKKEAPAPATK